MTKKRQKDHKQRGMTRRRRNDKKKQNKQITPLLKINKEMII